MKRKVQKMTALLLTLIIAASTRVGALAADNMAVNSVRTEMASIILDTVKKPMVDPIGGEWAVLALARSGYTVTRSYYEGYYKTVEAYVKECEGVLDERKYTEYSRVILGLTAAGFDPRTVGGYDLTMALGDFDKAVWQGINSSAYALIALDSAGYEIPKNPGAATQATRDMYIDEILKRQLPSGGFALSKSATDADADITGIVLQALSNYQNQEKVKTATNKALKCLSDMQGSGEGGFDLWGTETSESIVQVIVALCELGISIDDPRFIKNGNNLLDRLMQYYIDGKGFEHTIGGGVSQMANEQALYALAALYRAENGLSSLYDMSDVGIYVSNNLQVIDENAELNNNAQTTQPSATNSAITFSDIKGHKNQKAIEVLAARGIITGRDDGTFAPDATMTRAQFAAIIVRGIDLGQETQTPFLDIPEGAWYNGYVGAAFTHGIITGASKTSFNPEGLISKQEAATMVARAAKLKGIDTAMNEQAIRDILAQFPDYISAAEYAKEPLAFCYGSGILSQDNINIEPAKSITRSEIAEMLFQMLK